MNNSVEAMFMREQFNSDVFARIRHAMAERNDTSYWGMSKAISQPTLKESSDEHGSWFADTLVGDKGEHFGIACSIQPGELKVGITLDELRAKDLSEEEIKSISPDFRVPDIIRPMRSVRLYDWIYRGGALDIQWFHRAYSGDGAAADIVISTIASAVVNTWKGAAAVMTHRYRIFSHEYVIISQQEMDLQAIVHAIDGHIKKEMRARTIGQILILSTNESADRVAEIIGTLCPGATVNESEPV